MYINLQRHKKVTTQDCDKLRKVFQHMHDAHILHNDLSLRNVMRQDNGEFRIVNWERATNPQKRYRHSKVDLPSTLQRWNDLVDFIDNDRNGFKMPPLIGC